MSDPDFRSIFGYIFNNLFVHFSLEEFMSKSAQNSNPFGQKLAPDFEKKSQMETRVPVEHMQFNFDMFWPLFIAIDLCVLLPINSE